MLLPTPRFHKGNREVWKALVEAKKEGKIINIGVSNFNINDLKNIINNSEEKIFANQIRIHVGHVPTKVINFCKENNILVEAYSPFGSGRLRKNKTINELAKKYNVLSAQLCIKYDQQLGTIPLPRSRSENHIKSNLELDFKISDEDMKKLGKIKTF